MEFYQNCINLRDKYSAYPKSQLPNTRKGLLIKLMNIAFFSGDTLPVGEPIDIYCADIHHTGEVDTIKEILKQVLADLGFCNVYIWSNAYYLTHCISFTIN